LLDLLDQTSDGFALVQPHTWRIEFVNVALATWAKPLAGRPGATLDQILRTTRPNELSNYLQRAARGEPVDTFLSARLITSESERGFAYVDVRPIGIEIDGQRWIAVLVRKADSARNRFAGSRR